MQTEFTEIELQTVDVVESFLTLVPDEHKQAARDALHNAWRLGNHDIKPKCLIDLVTDAVRKDLLDRSTVGIKKYGTTLDRNSGDLRYWLNHAYEEALDHAQYLKRAIMEIDRKAEISKMETFDNGNTQNG